MQLSLQICTYALYMQRYRLIALVLDKNKQSQVNTVYWGDKHTVCVKKPLYMYTVVFSRREKNSGLTILLPSFDQPFTSA